MITFTKIFTIISVIIVLISLENIFKLRKLNIIDTKGAYLLALNQIIYLIAIILNFLLWALKHKI